MQSERYELTRADYRKNNLLFYGASLSPAVLAIPLPIVFLALFFTAGSTPAAAAFLFFGLISLGAGFLIGLILMIAIFWYRQNWLNNLRERLAVDGIRTNEVEWFKNELSTGEKQSLKYLTTANPLLADAYRETLASKLTATRIIKNTKNELQMVERRQNKLKYIKNENSKSAQEEFETDRQRLKKLRGEAENILNETKTRLETIEAAARRGTTLAGSEQAVKQLSERTAQLPLALEAARIEDEIRRELEAEDSK